MPGVHVSLLLWIVVVIDNHCETNSQAVYIYSDLQCHLDKHEVPVQTCLSGDKYYRSYELFCDV